MKRGWLIAIEGIDGAGKTTQARRLEAALGAAGLDVVLTKEPTNGPHGQKVRELSTAGAKMTPEEELGYFIEDRRDHVRDLIGPAIDSGAVVLCDRYYLSNVAYQGARGMRPTAILEQNESLFPAPHLVLLIVTAPAEGLRRVKARGDALNLSYERADFLTRAATIFASIDRPYIARIDGERSPDAVHQDVVAALAPHIDLRANGPA